MFKNKFINIHTHVVSAHADCVEVLQYSYSDSNQPLTIHSAGVHPWESHEIPVHECLSFLNASITNPLLYFIGECGLDRACGVPIDVQIPIFEASLLFAQAHKIPVIIHCVRAYSDLLSILKNLQITVPLLFHDFRGNYIQHEQLLAYSSYFSFGKSLFDSAKMQHVFREIPVSRIFLETDVADITIQQVYQVAAQIKNLSVENLRWNIVQSFTSILPFTF